MAKSKSVYVCSACGYETSRWMGRCPSVRVGTRSPKKSAPARNQAPERKLRRAPGMDAQALRVEEIPDDAMQRRPCGIGELDRVLGGGVVDGSVILVGGDPGVGKSTR